MNIHIPIHKTEKKILDKLGCCCCFFMLSLSALIAGIIMFEIDKEECPRYLNKYRSKYYCKEQSCGNFSCYCEGYCAEKNKISENIIKVRISLLVVGIIGVNFFLFLFCYNCQKLKEFRKNNNKSNNNTLAGLQMIQFSTQQHQDNEQIKVGEQVFFQEGLKVGIFPTTFEVGGACPAPLKINQ